MDPEYVSDLTVRTDLRQRAQTENGGGERDADRCVFVCPLQKQECSLRREHADWE